MRIVCVGGGPGGLYLAILAKARRPGDEVVVLERNRAGSTHGWGVVFGEDFLDDVYATDVASGRAVRAVARVWRSQRVCIGDRAPVHIGGRYGFSVDRARLLAALTARARELGVEVVHEHEVTRAPDADVVVAADGAGSALRAAGAFGTTLAEGRNHYAWLGTDHVLPGFTFAFEQTAAGWVWCHAYPSSGTTSTVIVECPPETWQRLHLDALDVDAGLRLLGDVFARRLGGRPLRLPPSAGDRSPWLRFREVRNTTWVDGNVVLLGDAAHTTHFAIGSGTVLAVRDAIALADRLERHRADVPAALSAYDRDRRAVVDRVQAAAARSQAWFEGVGPTLSAEHPVRLAYDLFNRQDDQAAWRYPLHLATQVTPLRHGRSAVTSARRAVRGLQREGRTRAGARRGPAGPVAGPSLP